MQLPFTPEQFLEVFRRYNTAFWPMQWLLFAVAVAILLRVRLRPSSSTRLVTGFLALLWLWMGAAYHLSFFSAINKAAYAFGALFIAQAIAFGWLARHSTSFTFESRGSPGTVVGWVLVTYALLIYPLLGYALGHRYPESPTFGLPCPTTIFTFGVLLWMKPPAPRWIFIVPLLWSVLGTSAALQLGMWEDLGLTAAAVATIATLVLRRRRHESIQKSAPQVRFS